MCIKNIIRVYLIIHSPISPSLCPNRKYKTDLCLNDLSLTLFLTDYSFDDDTSYNEECSNAMYDYETMSYCADLQYYEAIDTPSEANMGYRAITVCDTFAESSTGSEKGAEAKPAPKRTLRPFSHKLHHRHSMGAFDLKFVHGQSTLQASASDIFCPPGSQIRSIFYFINEWLLYVRLLVFTYSHTYYCYISFIFDGFMLDIYSGGIFVICVVCCQELKLIMLFMFLVFIFSQCHSIGLLK